jgi:hypothetical protein
MDVLEEFKQAIEPKKSELKQTLLPEPQHSRLRFIDGGSQEILHAGNVVLAHVRIVSVVFNGKKRESQEITNDTVLLKRNADSVSVKTEIEETRLPLSDSLTTTLNEYRKTLERKKAEGPFEGITIIDGEMDESTTSQKIIAISKTTEAEAGNIRGLADSPGTWYAGDEKSGYAKLHESSKHVFKIQLKNANIKDIATLKTHNDPAFLGYPYGLVVADQLARVSNKEIDAMRTKMRMKIGREANQSLKTHDAHKILDTMQF